MHRSSTARLIGLLFALAAGLAACAPAPRALTPVTVQLSWLHQATSAGFYAADQRGYYAEEGLAVSFREGGPDIDVFAAVKDGSAQFTIPTAHQVIEARAEGIPVRALAANYRRNPVVFISKAEAGIIRPQQFAGKTVRVIPQLTPTFHAMMARVGVTPDQYTEVNLPSDLATFLGGQAQVWGVYLNGFVVTAQQAGHRLNVIYPDDYGVHSYGEVIAATDSFIAANPDLTTRFLRATLKGWVYTVEHPEEVGAMVTKYKPDADVALENAKMAASLPLINTGEDQIGWMRGEIWTQMEQTLREQRVLTKPVDPAQTYTMQFLEQIYESGR